MGVQRLDNLLNPVVQSLMRKNGEKAARATICAAGSDVLLVGDLILLNRYLFLGLFQADMSHGIIAIEDLGDLLKGRSFSLREDKVNPDRFKDIPKSIEEPEIPAVRQVLNGDRIGLG